MTGALLGLLACLAMTGSAMCCALPTAQMTHGDHRQPLPEHQHMPAGCHAVLGCDGKRKLRTFP
nr:hypothetical protein [uncultured Sphingomonas sp.]